MAICYKCGAPICFRSWIRDSITKRRKPPPPGCKAWPIHPDGTCRQLQKIYGPAPKESSEVRYSPAQCMGAKPAVISGMPDHEHISTSFTERQNLTMRMSIRRFTRLTNAFSKKVANHEAAVALHFMYYNFSRVHQTLRCTPAMEAGISDHVWSLEEIVNLLR